MLLQLRKYTYPRVIFFFFFNDTATTEIYTLSLHDALPICQDHRWKCCSDWDPSCKLIAPIAKPVEDRKSTRLNSSHSQISYAVFFLKKKNNYKSIFSESTELSRAIRGREEIISQLRVWTLP